MRMSKEVKEEVKMWVANGWDLKEDTPEYVELTKNDASIGGHILVFILFGWWTLLIANLIYWLISNKKKRILK